MAEYARSPLNVILLAVVPVVFVTLSVSALAKFADLLGGTADTKALEASTAGWAAAFLAGVAAYFQVSGSRRPDRRLALAGLGAHRVVAARLVSGLALALLAAAGAVLALAVHTGTPTRPGRSLPPSYSRSSTWRSEPSSACSCATT